MKKIALIFSFVSIVWFPARTFGQVPVATGAIIVHQTGMVSWLQQTGISTANANGLAASLASLIGDSKIQGLNSNGHVYGTNTGPNDGLSYTFNYGGASLTASVTFDYTFDVNGKLLLTFVVNVLGKQLTGAYSMNVQKSDIANGISPYTGPGSAPKLDPQGHIAGTSGSWIPGSFQYEVGYMNGDGVYVLTQYTQNYWLWMPHGALPVPSRPN